MLFFLFKPNWCIRKFIFKCLLAPGWNVQGQQVLGVQGSAGDTEVAEPEQSPASPTAGGAPGPGSCLTCRVCSSSWPLAQCTASSLHLYFLHGFEKQMDS